MKDIEISKSTFILTIALVSVLAFSAGYSAFSPLMTIGHRKPKVSANLFIIFETAKGTWTYSSGNVITNIGEQYVRNIMGWDNVTNNNATQWIALGNSSIAQTKTKLDTEATSLGFTRAANDSCVAWMNGTDYAYNVTNKFTATGTIRVNASSIHWSPTSNSDNNCYALALITATTFENNDNGTMIWVLTWDAN